MIDAILIFVSQFSFILLLGLQSINVNSKHVVAAGLTSLTLGVVGFHVTGTIATAFKDGMFTLLWWSYILAGPLGIMASIKLHPKLVKFAKNDKNR